MPSFHVVHLSAWHIVATCAVGSTRLQCAMCGPSGVLQAMAMTTRALPSTMRLILVRHGQTACNVNDTWHGWDQCALTEEGREQAHAVGERLRDEPIDAVYASDLLRARQTAEAIAVPHGLTPILEPGLRERNAGIFQGMAAETVIVEHPEIWAERGRDKWGWMPPKGETLRDVLARALEVIDRIRAEHPDGTVVAVTHMSTKRALISRLAGIPIERTFAMEFPSTGVSILRFDPSGTVEVEELNSSAHVA